MIGTVLVLPLLFNEAFSVIVQSASQCSIGIDRVDKDMILIIFTRAVRNIHFLKLPSMQYVSSESAPILMLPSYAKLGLIHDVCIDKQLDAPNF